MGVIQLENFGDYTVAEGMDLDKTQIDRNYGGFLQLTSAKEVEFTLVFDSLCCFSEELIAKAIPISYRAPGSPGGMD